MVLDQFKLDGKVAVVTGAGRGIGQAYALGLAEAGADIAVVDVIPMDETLDAVKALGRRAIGIKADLAKGEKEAPKIVAKVVKALGRVDILVNNAGIIRREPFLEHSAKNWNDVISINLSTPFFLSQAVARQMVKQGQGGKIINIGSMLSYQGGILIPGYAAALIMSRFVPPVFVGIAFDSGGVASGPMTSTFLLPLAMGACPSRCSWRTS